LGATAQDDDKQPIPATTAPAAQPRDPNLLPQHEQARQDSDQAYRRGDHKKVIELTSAILAQNPKDHVALYLRASSRIEQGIAVRDAALVRSGITDAREAIAVKQRDNMNYYLPYLYGMTNLSGLENNPAHAKVSVDFATRLLEQPTLKGEERSNTLYQRALAYLVAKDNKSAIADYQEAVRLTPNHLGALVGLADTLAASGQFAPAMNAYNAAVKAHPNLPLVYNNRGMFEQANGKFDDAIADFTKALELDPMFVVALTNRGFVLMSQGRYEEAEIDFSESLRIDAAQPTVLSLRASSKLMRGDLDAAIKDYNDVLKWDTKNPVGHAELGFALFFAGQRAEALTAFETATQLDPKMRFLLPWRYLTMLHLDRKQQADQLFAADLAIPAAKREWSDAILIYLADKQSEQDLRRAINVADAAAAEAQNCEAEYFIGQRKLLAGQAAAAKAHFAAALKSKAKQLSAYRGAMFANK
jgi:lipoprotein NlpI